MTHEHRVTKKWTDWNDDEVNKLGELLRNYKTCWNEIETFLNNMSQKQHKSSYDTLRIVKFVQGYNMMSQGFGIVLEVLENLKGYTLVGGFTANDAFDLISGKIYSDEDMSDVIEAPIYAERDKMDYDTNLAEVMLRIHFEGSDKKQGKAMNQNIHDQKETRRRTDRRRGIRGTGTAGGTQLPPGGE